MLSQNSPESTLTNNPNPLKLVWFKDGVGINNGTNTYSIRASNFFLNLQRMAGFTTSTLAFVASSLPPASAVDDSQTFKINGTNDQFIGWSWNFHGDHLGDLILSKLRNGTCNVVPVNYSGDWDGYSDCVMMRTREHYWLFDTNPVTPTICDNLYKVSRCIADLAMQYGNQTSTVFPASDPNIPPSVDSHSDNSLTPAAIAMASVASVCALGTLAFFGRKIYKKYVANSDYVPAPTAILPVSVKPDEVTKRPFNLDYSDPENYICPVHLETMKDPYQLDCGHNLDFSSLQNLKPHDKGECTCPICRGSIKDPKPNNKLKTVIQNYNTTNKTEVAIEIYHDTTTSNESVSTRMKM